MSATFENFFRTATGNAPYDYHSRLAGGDLGTACKSTLISNPTGLGNTATDVLAWLWNRVAYLDPAPPQEMAASLVYCLRVANLRASADPTTA